MYKDTLEAIDICFYKNIIEYSSESSQFYPKSRIEVPDLVYDDNKTIIASSKLLGFWFAKLSIEEICISLNINF